MKKEKEEVEGKQVWVERRKKLLRLLNENIIEEINSENARWAFAIEARVETLISIYLSSKFFNAIMTSFPVYKLNAHFCCAPLRSEVFSNGPRAQRCYERNYFLSQFIFGFESKNLQRRSSTTVTFFFLHFSSHKLIFFSSLRLNFVLLSFSVVSVDVCCVVVDCSINFVTANLLKHFSHHEGHIVAIIRRFNWFQ